MNTTKSDLVVRGIPVDVVYKDIKNLHIAVYPPLGRVRVAAPTRLDDDLVRLAVVHRLPWIKQRRAQLIEAERQSERELVTGETHYVWGQRRRLRVVERPGRAHVEVDGPRLLLYVPPGMQTSARSKVLQEWRRAQLRERIPNLVAKWQPRIGREVHTWSIRVMKTKWGSCNRETGHLWFNLELAKKPPECLEYLVVHEMTHLLERQHGKRFVELMDGFMPDWRARQTRLNAEPLQAW